MITTTTTRKAVRHPRQFRYLIEDAQRDWAALGQERLQIVPLARFRSGAPVTLSEGVLFTTYATLRSEERQGKASRLQQIVAWLGRGFDGVIVFDEAHAMANAAGDTGERGDKSKTHPRAQDLSVPAARDDYRSPQPGVGHGHHLRAEPSGLDPDLHVVVDYLFHGHQSFHGNSPTFLGCSLQLFKSPLNCRPSNICRRNGRKLTLTSETQAQGPVSHVTDVFKGVQAADCQKGQ